MTNTSPLVWSTIASHRISIHVTRIFTSSTAPAGVASARNPCSSSPRRHTTTTGAGGFTCSVSDQYVTHCTSRA
ncbi:hypothetical protein NI26_09435 [Curtobacterium sp. MR_MD2014]|nr:hypothetical protein NI26_09435 [Curtobacterium sp. MR_MD2014]